MGEKLMEGLGISFVGITVVFSSLLILCAIIYLFPMLNPNKNKKSSNTSSGTDKELIDTTTNDVPETKKTESDLSDDSLIAILTAAVLASMGNKPDVKIRVSSFKRIQQTSPAWNATGRREYISNKLS